MLALGLCRGIGILVVGVLAAVAAEVAAVEAVVLSDFLVRA
jgi:hypothetical protein